mmetsp:Transcript_35871/g.106512  ORF Transcript_35871/g.106512 Transcript_35871/m.106512 type:complete len:314 (+) Transcript_35871:182-1123(+)
MAFLPLAWISAASAVLLHSLIRASSCASRTFRWSEPETAPAVSVAVCPGPLISGPRFRMKSVQTFVLTLEARLASSSSWARLSTSSTVSVASLASRLSASSCSFFAVTSAASTRPWSCLTSSFAFSSMAIFAFVSASLLSCSALRRRLMASMRARACDMPCSHSFSSPGRNWASASGSWASIASWSSFCSSAKVSTVAWRTFWITLRMASAAICSCRMISWAVFPFLASSAFFFCSCSFFVSSARFLSCSALFLFSSSVCFLRASSRRFRCSSALPPLSCACDSPFARPTMTAKDSSTGPSWRPTFQPLDGGT